MSENNKKLLALLSRVLDIDRALISDNTSPENTDSWDSYNALLLVSELEIEFNVHFSMEEVYAVKCVKDIKEALIRHNVGSFD
jgi:acyl carrier protein